MLSLKKVMLCFISFICLFLLPGLNRAQGLKPTEFVHHTTLDADNKFQIFWTPDEEGLTMEMVVETLGWVSVGFSPNGGMTGSDIFLAYVTDAGEVEAMVSNII